MSAPGRTATTIFAWTLPPPRKLPSLSNRTIASSARLCATTVGRSCVDARFQLPLGRRRRRQSHLQPRPRQPVDVLGQRQARAQTPGADHAKERIAHLHEIARRDDLHLDRAVDRGGDARLREVALRLLARARAAARLSRSAFRCASASSAAFCEMKPCATSFCSALEHQFLLRKERLQAGDLGGVGARLDLEVARVDLGEQLALTHLLAGIGVTRTTRPATSALMLGSSTYSIRADHLLEHLQVARLDRDPVTSVAGGAAGRRADSASPPQPATESAAAPAASSRAASMRAPPRARTIPRPFRAGARAARRRRSP
ncbi:MAG: hypothetical protein RML56_04005 [Burkholderiales bacterium]|nr:hypothetical protein [Burkholderiales bacterium]